LNQTHESTKIKYFIMSFPHFTFANNLIIKNIYLHLNDE
jgi:hypothetical protein